jgi:poly-beta-1,6-N-acetyl-D-glucosamine biosynthesis protein PgaD
MRAVDAVITEPTHVPRVRRGLFGAITFMAWTGFLWLLAPAVTLVLWLVGIRTAWDTTVGRFGSVDPVLACVVFLLSAVAACTLLLWAEVQRRRFTGVERRRRAPDATPEEIASELGCDQETARVLRSATVVSLRMRADGSPEAATPVRIPRPRRPVDEARAEQSSRR